jgi:hypothetical protein
MKTQAKLEKGCKSYFNLIKNGKVYQIICGEHLIGEIGDLCPTCQAQLTQSQEDKKLFEKLIDELYNKMDLGSNCYKDDRLMKKYLEEFRQKLNQELK